MKSRGFTLIELLVVITILLLLIAVLSPALRSAWELSLEAKCMSNFRQLVLAAVAFSKEHNGQMPFPNWLRGSGWAEPVPGGGWGYAVPALYNPGGAHPATSSPMRWRWGSISPGYPWRNEPEKVKKGQLWPYVGTLGVYRCPMSPIDELTAEQEYTTRELSTYRYNGALISFSSSQWEPCDMDEFQPDDIFMWEADRFGTDDCNDLSDYPYEYRASHHRNGSMVGCIDGRANAGPAARINMDNMPMKLRTAAP
ncbi:MAG: prepilin-type N-terminal cleavage/methylation domain-containing protein [Phycisphaerae bacterium]|nr:prepilin-type N-terminal cleavage/methylation domain-containing protein [Phycisphaerae bacterium]